MEFDFGFGLQRIQPLEHAVKVYCDNPLNEIWNTFLKVADISYLSRHWKDRSMEDYVQVSTLLTQAHEYHIASKTVSLRTKPLLIYYSFLNLTKALLFMRSDKEPSDYHGLCNPKAGPSLLDFSIQTNHGAFLSLAEHFGYRVKEKQRFSFRDFASNVVELRGAFIEYFGEVSKIVVPDVAAYISGPITITVDGPKLCGLDLSYVQATPQFKRLTEDFGIMEEKPHRVFLVRRIAANNLSPEDVMKKHFIFSALNDGQYYWNLNDESKALPQALAHFGLMYALATIVRYKPQDIHNFLDDKTTSVRWFLEKTCSTAERIFPNLLLNLLYERPKKFISGSAF